MDCICKSNKKHLILNGWKKCPDCGKYLIGEYFSDYDEESGMFCIFHTDINTGFAYGVYADEKEAEKEVKRLNNE